MSHLRNAREPPWNVDPLVRLALAKPLVCAPGTCFSYAHTNFVLLAEVLQKAAGQTVARLIRSRVLVPLGLCNTDSPSTPAIRPPVLHVYATDGGPYEDSTYWNESWTAAPGSVMTTNIYDLASSGNAIGTGRLLSAQSYAAQVAPLTARFKSFNGNLYYGLGLVVSHSWIVQNPSFAGYAAVMAYLPSKRITLAVTTTGGRHTPATANYAQLLARKLSTYLAPARPLVLP